MSRREWSDEEIIMVVFFASQEIHHSTIKTILRRRGYERGRAAITLKLKKIRDTSPHLKGPSGNWWTDDSVHQWLNQQISSDEIWALTRLSDEEVALIREVSAERNQAARRLILLEETTTMDA